MVIDSRKIIWDKQAYKHLKEIYDYVKKDSLSGAQKIKTEIYAAIERLPANPYQFTEDPLKSNNDGSYRVFFIYSYRISYRITETAILIFRIRHTSREPKLF